MSERKNLKILYGGKDSMVNINHAAALEGEIRNQLLKSGGVAFVKEDPKAFLELDDVVQIITEAGGIPTYPVLLDDKSGNYTEYEEDMEQSITMSSPAGTSIPWNSYPEEIISPI